MDDVEQTHSPVGLGVRLAGDLTTLNRIGPRPTRMIEGSLGFPPGSLRAGYFILLLKEPLRSVDFEMSTSERAGKSEEPAKPAPKARPQSLDDVVIDHRARRSLLPARRTPPSGVIAGPMRLAIILDSNGQARDRGDRPHSVGVQNDRTILTVPKTFLVAAAMRVDGTILTPNFTISLSENLPPDELAANLSRVHRFLERA